MRVLCGALQLLLAGGPHSFLWVLSYVRVRLSFLYKRKDPANRRTNEDTPVSVENQNAFANRVPSGGSRGGQWTEGYSPRIKINRAQFRLPDADRTTASVHVRGRVLMIWLLNRVIFVLGVSAGADAAATPALAVNCCC